MIKYFNKSSLLEILLRSPLSTPPQIQEQQRQYVQQHYSTSKKRQTHGVTQSSTDKQATAKPSSRTFEDGTAVLSILLVALFILNISGIKYLVHVATIMRVTVINSIHH